MSLKIASKTGLPYDDSSTLGGATGRTKDPSPRPAQPLRNEKYEHFAHLIARGESPARAYVLCGYSKKGALLSGNRLRRRADVSARVEELKRSISECQMEKIAVDRAWVMARLVENVQRALQTQPVRDEDGNPIGQYVYQGGVANKALELLGKELGMFQPKNDKERDAQEKTREIHEARDRELREIRRREAAANSTAPIQSQLP
jgi:hypothetical protein